MSKFSHCIRYSIYISVVFILTEVFNQTVQGSNIPFSTNETNLLIWNGRDYEPFFLKGMNFGVAVPGKFPGELAVSRAQYGRWFQLIKDAGFNSIRLYTLHYPDFYEVLDSFNIENNHNPLYFFQGVWLEEELEGFNGNLFFLDDAFTNEIEENVDCTHGNRIIEPRLGKAWGTYQTDVSQWNMGYIIGREVHPYEVLRTNNQNQGINSFTGDHFAIEDVLPAESWVVSKLDHLVGYEFGSYETQRPVSFSSWPTQDPLEHPDEWNRWEDTTSIDLSHLQLINAPGGFFISYHAYPYYPDFINYEEEYQNYADNVGPNSYMGYLNALKDHYPDFPLIIAEYGVPSSLGIAHYSTSGMHHGGFNEYEQGETNIRILKTIESSGGGGGMQFSWIDEWFKRTWVTDHIDYLMDRRILWHNVTAAEQNFGLIGFNRPLQMEPWESFCPACAIKSIDAAADYDYFHLKLSTDGLPAPLDEMWISIDTYDQNLGESILPSGDTVQNRAEFVLHITNYAAKLYVTQAYDLYGIFHNVSAPEQKYRSIVSDGAPWKIVRWKVNEFDQDIQFIGNLNLNYGFLPESSHDAVTIHQDHIQIRLPWSLLHFVDPSEYVVFHDDRNTWQPEDTISDGISVSVFYKGQEFTPSQRYLWQSWNTALDVEEFLKDSYWVMKDRLTEFNNRAIARNDSIMIEIYDEPAFVSYEDGVLMNDFDLDGNFIQTLMLSPPAYGRIELGTDGSFSYQPTSGFKGEDSFSYVLFDGYSLSEPGQVFLTLELLGSADDFENTVSDDVSQIFPNPARDLVKIESERVVNNILLFDARGQLVLSKTVAANSASLNVTELTQGAYFVVIQYDERNEVQKLMVY